MLIEPVALSDFFLSFFSAALIMVCATLYAALFAWAKLGHRTSMYWGAGLAYLLLLACIALFSHINHFNGYWLVLSFLMALGYGGMPYLIWRLCVLSHHDH